ncbi:hypothetical protein ACWEQP_27390 [Streptomyces sp. NPDC004044]
MSQSAEGASAACGLRCVLPAGYALGISATLTSQDAFSDQYRQWSLTDACVMYTHLQRPGGDDRTIRAAAEALTAIPDLQQRADTSQEATLMPAPVNTDNARPKPMHMAWPGALKECLAEHLRLCAAPEENLSAERHGLGDEK